MKSKAIITLFFFAFVLVACRTTIESHRLTSTSTPKNGLPYYLPKYVLLVREPIEVDRQEELFALLQLGGIHQYLFALPTQNSSQAIADLKSLLNLTPADQVLLVPSDQQMTVMVETSEKSTSKTTEEQSGKKSVKDSQKGTLTSSDTEESTKTENITEATIEDSKESSTGGTEESSNDESQKFELIPAPSQILGESKVFQKAADPAKSYEIISVPNLDQQYELILKPSLFASSKINLTFGDGWRLEGFQADTGENQLVDAFTSLAETLIGARKETQLAEIGKEQALELANLEQGADAASESTGTPQAAPAAKGAATKVELRVVGYIKKVTLEVLEPGVQDLQTLASGGSLNTKTVLFWQRVHF